MSDGVWSLHRGRVVDLASVRDYDSHDPYVVALHPGSGKLRWQRPVLEELVAIDGVEVACMEQAGDEQTVLLCDAASGSEIWRNGPHDFFCAGEVFFTAHAVGVVEVMALWLADRVTGATLGRVTLDDLNGAVICATPAGVFVGMDHGIARLN